MIFISLTRVFLFSQNISGIGIYSIKLAEDALYYPAKLTFTETESVFQFKNYHKKKWVREEGDGPGQFQIISTDSIGELVVRKGDKMTVRSFCQENPYVFSDYVSVKWQRTQESRLIEGMVCKKAKTNFRGREYSAWYCPEVKVEAGPWKFFGLPGLIIEVIDQTSKVHIFLKSLKIQKERMVKTPKLIATPITYSEFVKCIDIQWKKEIERNNARILKIQAKFPDLEITDNGISKKRRIDLATEKEYE